MKLNITKEQAAAMADREGDSEVGAGAPTIGHVTFGPNVTNVRIRTRSFSTR